MALFVVMAGLTIYELKRFGFLYECISDHQVNYLNNKGVVIQFIKNLIIVICNYRVLQAFKDPEIESDDNEQRLIVMDDSKEPKIQEEFTNYVEYVI